jgi:threonine dehydrogenase-like Zn-dependent dehydrogenase
VLQSPLVLGHEAGGVIATLPDDYEGEFKVGDNVAIEAGVNCGSCQYDRQGRYNLCKVSFGSPLYGSVKPKKADSRAGADDLLLNPCEL